MWEISGRAPFSRLVWLVSEFACWEKQILILFKNYKRMEQPAAKHGRVAITGFFQGPGWLNIFETDKQI